MEGSVSLKRMTGYPCGGRGRCEVPSPHAWASCQSGRRLGLDFPQAPGRHGPGLALGSPVFLAHSIPTEAGPCPGEGSNPFTVERLCCAVVKNTGFKGDFWCSKSGCGTNQLFDLGYVT